MDKAVFDAFHGDYEGILDRLNVVSMNEKRNVDGCTPLMAACARCSPIRSWELICQRSLLALRRRSSAPPAHLRGFHAAEASHWSCCFST
jgi:hypothetical protein